MEAGPFRRYTESEFARPTRHGSYFEVQDTLRTQIDAADAAGQQGQGHVAIALPDGVAALGQGCGELAASQVCGHSGDLPGGLLAEFHGLVRGGVHQAFYGSRPRYILHQGEPSRGGVEPDLPISPVDLGGPVGRIVVGEGLDTDGQRPDYVSGTLRVERGPVIPLAV